MCHACLLFVTITFVIVTSILLQVGDAQSRRADGDGSNTYATLLSPEKIEQLEVCTHIVPVSA
jgi:hypothetical protein